MGCSTKGQINLKDIKISDKIRSRLYNTVLDLFSENDFHQVNIREISRRTGISSGTIYKYFSSKEDLLFSILDEKITEIENLVKLHISGMENTKEIFRKVFWTTMDFYDKNPGVAITSFITVPMRTWMQEDAYRRRGNILLTKKTLAECRAKGDIDSSIDDRHISDLYYMFCHRHIHSWYFYGMRWKLSETIDDFFNLFWKTISPAEK